MAVAERAERAEAQTRYKPPVERESQSSVAVWFGEVKRAGHWCVLDKKAIGRLEAIRPEGREFGWARYDAHGLVSVTDANESEDAYAEDRYLVDPAGAVIKMVRTGHYINDPWASVTFEPDAKGRLRLTPSSSRIVRMMKAAGYDPYFATDWGHVSRLTQLPYAKLLDLKAAPMPGRCL